MMQSAVFSVIEQSKMRQVTILQCSQINFMSSTDAKLVPSNEDPLSFLGGECKACSAAFCSNFGYVLKTASISKVYSVS